MKLSLLLTAALASVTTTTAAESKRRKGKYPFKDVTTCSDFEGRWESIDGDDYSNLFISIVCDGHTATLRYSDDKWSNTTCPGDGSGGPGGFVADYTLSTDDSSIGRDGNFNLTCQGQDPDPTANFGDNSFVLKDNGSLQWFDFYNFWPTSTN